MKQLSTLAILLLFSSLLFASQNRKVLVIGVDGARSDALQQANTPNLDALIAGGLFTYDAWHLGITVSGPSWSTIMTGVWWNKHGVTNNNYTGSNYNTYPYFPTRAKEHKPNLQCVQVVEWAPMSDNVYNDGWNSKLITPDGDGAATAAVASTQLADPNLDCLFVYFDAIDLAGHSSGFSPNNPAYIAAIENVDDKIGIVINALHNRVNYASEEWLILVVPDHGGIGTGHGGITFEERHIWWIASGAGITHQQITATDPGTYNLLGLGIYNANGVNQTLLQQSPVQADIAVTALHWLLYDTGIQPENVTAWNLDGKSWLNTFTSVADEKEESNLTLFPNPANNLLSCWFQNPKHSPVSYQLLDAAGAIVLQQSHVQADSKLNITLQGLPAATYTLQLQVGEKTYSQRVVRQ